MRSRNNTELSVVVMREHNINGVPFKDYTTLKLNLTLTLT